MVNPSAVPMYSVVSSQLSFIGYDEDKAELFVTFKKGQTYKYSDVPKAIFTRLKNADSVGSFYATNIKGKYESEKVN